MSRNVCVCLVLLLLLSDTVAGQDVGEPQLRRQFDEVIAPFMATHCQGCHDAKNREAELDLSLFQSLEDVSNSHPVWATILDRVEAGEMPPEDAESQPRDEQRAAVVQWLRAFRALEAQRQAGDPGPVLARRLSNAEYDYSIRDLTGVDIRPTQTFPVDPANAAGFDNSGESLAMSPALLQKYLEAARRVADHLALTPIGIDFAPHPVVTDTDRDKYCVKRIVDFYEQQPTDYAKYFLAAWDYRRQLSAGQQATSLSAVAEAHRVSEKYLPWVWSILNESEASLGPLPKLQSMWVRLANTATDEEAELACQQMRDYVLEVRKKFEPKFENLAIPGVHAGSQSFVLWKNQQYAASRRQADFRLLDGSPQSHGEVSPGGIPAVEADERAAFEAACRHFCHVFPDAFYISERGRDYLDTPKEKQEKGRLLSAGFHSMMGYFRDDQPLMELILDDQERQTLDDLWQELDFLASAPQRQYQGFLWFERTDSGFMREAEFDFARPEDKAALSQTSIEQLSEVYLAKAIRQKGQDPALQAIRDFFYDINAQIRWVEQARVAAEPRHLEAICQFAERAYRRPLTTAEEAGLRDFYHELRTEDLLDHEEAIQDVLVSILVSPKFSYRLDLLGDSEQARPLDDYELASRLSYFLWSSVPDEELLRQAATGELRNESVLERETLRMLRDPRARGLATEFGGNWLDFRRFEEHNSVDRGRFTSFDDELRSSMFEEPIRFFLDVLQNDRSGLEFLHSKRTFVNAALAKHYSIEGLSLAPGEWHEVADASEYGRGGVLPMAVFLTKNAPGLRTSPVKRGYWVVRRLLGERIPAPPPNVPELPADEAQLGELTLRETLAKHREHTSCAGCHNRIDSIGLVFEGYGPIGERREVDLGGRPVDPLATFPDGSQRSGVDDLRRYLHEQREDDFIDNLSGKLLSYALGRSLQLSDESLLADLREEWRANDFRLTHLIAGIVTSPQFLNKRGRAAAQVATAATTTSFEDFDER